MPDDLYSPVFVRGLFDRMSRSYERMNYVTSFGFSARWRNQLLKQVKRSHDTSRVLDLMCGMGETWAHVRRAFPDAQLSALDFSSEMVAGAARKNADRFGGAVHLITEDFLQTTLPDASYDLVVCAYGLKTFSEAQLDMVVAQTARILRPGGQFAFIEVTLPAYRALRSLYAFYLSRVVPIVGILLASDPKEYRMLWRYVSAFDRAESADAAFAHPLLSVIRANHFFGCATSFSGARRGLDAPAPS